jgi:hypothetical protein
VGRKLYGMDFSWPENEKISETITFPETMKVK